MLLQDPPDHTRLRGLVVKAFTARRVEDMRSRIQQIVDQTLDRVVGRRQMDLIEDFAYPLPVSVICEMLGIPGEHREVFRSSFHNGGRLLDPVPQTKAEIDQANLSNAMGRRYFRQLCELRRRKPSDDLTTQLVQAEQDGSKLSNEELTANIILLFGAGHETTASLIGNGLLALHRNPDQLALLKARPDLMTNAIEEFLRYDSSVQLSARVALEDIDDSVARKSRRAKPCSACWAQLTVIPHFIPTGGPARCRPSRYPSFVLWRGHPPLPRCPVGQDPGGDRDFDSAAPPPGA